DAVEHIFQLICAGHSTLPPFDLAIAEDDQRGNALYPVCRCDGGIAIDVHFQDGDTFTHFVLDFLEYRRHHFAGTAPFRREIHEDRFIALDDLAEGPLFTCCHIRSISCKVSEFCRLPLPSRGSHARGSARYRRRWFVSAGRRDIARQPGRMKATVPTRRG